MKVNNPISRYHLQINRKYKVLEVGGGHNPHTRSNIVVDKYLDDNTHRSGNLSVLKHQKFLHADGEQLPFTDNEFDYVICCHVLEHVPNPAKFIQEQTRVAKMGYMETPSLIGEYLAPKESHKWVLMEIDEKIVMYEKEKLGFNFPIDIGDVFLHYLPSNSLGYKLMLRSHQEIMTLNYQWRQDIDFLVNPEDEYYLKYFTQPWDKEVCKRILRQRSMTEEVAQTLKGILAIMKDVFKHKVLKLR